MIVIAMLPNGLKTAAAAGLGVVLFTATTSALAADGGATATTPASSSDVRALEKQLNDEHAALSTSDCNSACRALGSIRRAAEKICSIEPGPRCEAARGKAADATKRVREACPDCTVASGPIFDDAHERAAEPPSPPPPQKADAAGSANAPQSESRRGGCASCSSTDAASGVGTNADIGFFLLAAFTVSRIFRRKSRSRK